MWQANKNNMISEMRERVLELVKIEPIKYKFIIDSLSLLPTILTEPAHYLHFATIYMAEISEYIHRIAQISDYNWLDINSITQCYTVLNKYMQSEYYTCEQDLYNSSEPEQNGIIYTVENIGPVIVNGRVDAVDCDTLWELKCTNELTIEHKLQTLVYADMWRRGMQVMCGPRKCKLLNIRTEEMYELDTTSELITEAMILLLQNKYKGECKKSDAVFITECMTVIEYPYTYNNKPDIIYSDKWMGSKLE